MPMNLCKLLPGLAAIVCVAPGCQTPLNQFECSTPLHCPSGKCEDNGYCSFPDGECDSGWRYGESSGPDSGQCVLGVDDQIDAGVDFDARRTEDDPVAVINDVFAPCNITTVELDGSDSSPGQGATLTNYQWKLYDPNGVFIGMLEGEEEQPIPLSTHLAGGQVSVPLVNFANYMDASALRINTIGLADATHVSQVAEGSAGGDYRLFLSLASTTESLVTVTVLSAAPYQQVVAVGSSFKAHQFDLPATPSGGEDTEVLIQFQGQNIFWLDNVALIEDGAGGAAQLTQNRSFEVSTDGWESSFPVSESLPIPVGMRTNGTYRAELTVTNSRDQVSDPTSIFVEITSCTP